MAELSLYQALTIYAWFPLAFTLAVLMLIARFYERFSGKYTFWPLYAVPVLGYAAAHVREAALGAPGDVFADVMQAVSGVVLLLLTLRLSLMMLRHREAVPTMSPPLLMVGGAIGEIALGAVLFIFARFTRRMALLNRQPPYHRLYYIGAAGMWSAAALRVLQPDGATTQLLVYPALVAISMTIGAVVSWRAWSWLLAERG